MREEDISRIFGLDHEQMKPLYELSRLRKRRQEVEVEDFISRMNAWRKVFEERIAEFMRSN